tara:strand:- start:11150 stop:12130 length:981 start_codon:yes stop_codon:yes gene_type:complete
MRPKIVCLGGGTGQAAILEGLQQLDVDITAIVGVTDNGGYSGLIRQAMDIPQVGDSRSVVSTLAKDGVLKKLLKYRFTEGNLSGVALGNLMLAALTRIEGDFGEALQTMSNLVGVRGRVLPVSNESTQICAELLDGSKIEGEWEIIKQSKSKVMRLYLKKAVSAAAGVVKALGEADMIVVCPGSLRTGIIPILLVDGVGLAIAKSKAKKVFVTNVMTHPGQTDHFTTSMHVDEVKKYGDFVFDYVLVNSGKPSDELLDLYKKDGALPVKIDSVGEGMVIVDNFVADLDRSQLLELERASGKDMVAFPHLIRHDSEKVAKILMELVK